MDLIKKNPKITRNELSSILKISSDGIKYNLDIMKQKNILRRIGSTKGGYLEIIKKN